MITPRPQVFCSKLKLCISILGVNLLAFNCSTAAQYHASVYLGGTTTKLSHVGPLYFVDETDLLEQRNNNFADVTWGLAAAVRLKASGSLQQLVEEFSFGPEFFYFSSAGVGDVWQYRLPEMNNLTYRLPIKSYRLLVTDEITFKPISQMVFPFFEWGLGVAANQSSYQEYPRPTYNAPGLTLTQHTQYQFAYTLGGGLKIDISDWAKLKTNQLQLSLRYLYANLGSATTSNRSSAFLTTPISVDLSTQTWVAGLTYLI
ncbi:outer membrane protein [Legionella waltersii]|nr:hypothetical protein [Legionella waltersii]